MFAEGHKCMGKIGIENYQKDKRDHDRTLLTGETNSTKNSSKPWVLADKIQTGCNQKRKQVITTKYIRSLL